MSTGLTVKNGTDAFGTVSVAMVTPFDPDGALDIEASRRLAVHLVDHGVDSLVLAGTTGESPTTTVQEKLSLLAAVKEEVGDRAKLVAGVGTNNTSASVELSRLSAEAGADALLVVTPYYSKPSPEGVFRHFAAIGAATNLPICLYDIPGRSGIALGGDLIRRLAELSTVVGMKDATGDLGAAATLIDDTGLAWYSGDDPLNLPFLSIGATGFISVVGHAAPQALRELHSSFEEGDLVRARKINATVLTPLNRALARLGGVTFAKAALRAQGLEVGEPRLPLVGIDDAAAEELHRDLNQAGVL